MDKVSFEELFRRYYEKQATAEEEALLFQLVQESANADRLLEVIQLSGLDHESPNDTVIDAGGAHSIVEDILLQTRGDRAVILKMRWWKYASVAAVFVLVAGVFWRSMHGTAKPMKEIHTIASKSAEIRPGGNKAVLTLADGKQIILDSVGAGNIADEGQVRIVKTEEGQVSYVNEAGGNEVLINMISTPIGGQYKILLADGSKVWLNAASSLRYPARFGGKERRVELKGEGYFEIAHDATKPFRVEVNGTTVEVLGTHFNINAYSDEPQLRTTLLEGKVKMENGGTARFLRPGQQAIVDGEGRMSLVNDADLEEAVAWKDGKFIFNGNNIYSVMRQLSRWYDISVQYSGQMPDDEFVGVIPIPRSENISVILNLLHKTKVVNFKVDGRNVIVSPY